MFADDDSWLIARHARYKQLQSRSGCIQKVEIMRTVRTGGSSTLKRAGGCSRWLQSGTTETKKRKKQVASIGQSVHATKRYPRGLSIQPVASRGPLPVCVGCRHSFERGDRRLLRHTKVNLVYTRIDSAHLRVDCLSRALSVADKTQFASLVDNDAQLNHLGL